MGKSDKGKSKTQYPISNDVLIFSVIIFCSAEYYFSFIETDLVNLRII